ncbi:hypothetical protein RJ641_034292, partial [Dillenia turbinata]
YKAAIKADPLCFEDLQIYCQLKFFFTAVICLFRNILICLLFILLALERLIENHMLTCDEERSLLSSIQFGPEDQWLSSFYLCLIKKYDRDDVVEAKFGELEKRVAWFDESPDFSLYFSLLEKDPFHLKGTLVHLAAAMELGHSNELYLLACNLVKDYPQKALSWFAVGCYYFCLKKYTQFCRYFRFDNLDIHIANLVDSYGNVYAAQEEGAIYLLSRLRWNICKRTTSNLLLTCKKYLIHLCIFVFSFSCKTVCPSDPLVYNELGIVAYHVKE